MLFFLLFEIIFPQGAYHHTNLIITTLWNMRHSLCVCLCVCLYACPDAHLGVPDAFAIPFPRYTLCPGDEIEPFTAGSEIGPVPAGLTAPFKCIKAEGKCLVHQGFWHLPVARSRAPGDDWRLTCEGPDEHPLTAAVQHELTDVWVNLEINSF